MMKLKQSLLALLMLLAHMVTLAATQVTSTMTNADYADVHSDASGNMHIVWTADDTVDGRALYYKMLNSSGSVLIDATRIDNGGTGGPAAYPSVTVDSSTLVYVIWQAGTGPDIYYMRLNPLLDDRNGTAADIATIKEIGDTNISATGAAQHPRMELDSNASLHVVWETGCTGVVEYLRIAADATVQAGPVSLGPSGTRCSNFPDIALDSNRDAHVLFTSPAVTAADELYYAMIDGSSGSILIDATRLTADDGLAAGSATLSVNLADNHVFAVYKEETGAGGPGSEEIFIATLDPAVVVQDGSVADPAVLRLGLQQFTDGNGLYRWHVFSRIGQDRRLHILSTDFDDSVCPAAPHAIENAHVTYAGRVLLRQTLTTSARSCSASVRLEPRDYRVVWTDDAAGSQEIFLDTFARADAGKSGFTCALRAPGGGPGKSADFWLLLAVIIMLGVRTVVRSNGDAD